MTETKTEKSVKNQTKQGKIKVNFFIRKNTDQSISKYSDKLSMRKSELVDLILGDEELLTVAMKKHIASMQENILE